METKKILCAHSRRLSHADNEAKRTMDDTGHPFATFAGHRIKTSGIHWGPMPKRQPVPGEAGGHSPTMSHPEGFTHGGQKTGRRADLRNAVGTETPVGAASGFPDQNGFEQFVQPFDHRARILHETGGDAGIVEDLLGDLSGE